ncbi:superkiller complex protein 2-like [Montipora foliosa]|uniref:superkiller complex protein 2-like n=1 Tax=Montipora foliosa TaxID=591990 RepID=UPI0035F11E62
MSRNLIPDYFDNKEGNGMKEKEANDECDPLEYEFDLLEIGCTGTIEVIPQSINKTSKKELKPLTTLPSGLPPLFAPDLKCDLEKYLLDPTSLPIHDFHKTQRFWPRERDSESLLFADVCPVPSTLKVERNPTTGELLGYNEVMLTDTGSTAKNSMSLLRQPGPLSASVRGESTNYPFLPGGMETQETSKAGLVLDGELNFEKDLLSMPPGFTTGVFFNDVKEGEEEEVIHLEKDLSTSTSTPQVLAMADIMAGTTLEDLEYSDEEDELESDESDADEIPGKEESNVEQGDIIEGNAGDSLENVLVKEQASAGNKFTSAAPVTEKPVKQQWAVKINVTEPVKDFHKRVPNMAHKWPFELDTFQKQAVLCLENNECVFVAAHTSAGKTVVAEYAIALANKHMTKTVYTSPIKALSNQKFREFKDTFEDVGLLTGDVQIRPEASCLIMTTEILRSMLYNGSDTIRDVEWVIFDEVHYINDEERGVVWEEVLIMLPAQVKIILLSATVPNTLEFADWIGRTKRKKIYVISTPKRPVPLEHFLYTGNSNKTSNELFMIVDANSNFLTRGHEAAVAAKKAREGKSKDAYGPKSHQGTNIKEERNIWLSLIEMLRKKEKLPVVAFTFSRKRCDENADQLGNLDLTTSTEKSLIHVFIKKCVARLKGSDRDLPQVSRIQELLKRGLGVHHSGVLPIIKEMVEMLFGRGLVKILFATETFAMGVNMPARTVVFDSIRKHDGTNFRDLLSGEYIQMAGRAGRRGLDPTGTVILLCKGSVHLMADLHKMMLGKPTQLVSRFRLTYSMILNLLRVEELRVEDMMKRSFAEFHVQKDSQERKREMDELEKKLLDIKELECTFCSEDLKYYFKTCKELSEVTRTVQAAILSSSHGQRALSPGRVVTINTAEHRNALAVILQAENSSNQGYSTIHSHRCSSPEERKFLVLVISDLHEQSPVNNVSAAPTPSVSSTAKEGLTEEIQPFVKRKLFLPEGRCSHRVMHVNGSEVSAISVRAMKVDTSKIIADHKKRMQPRFRNDPPGKTTISAEQELLRLSEANPEGLSTMDPVRDFNIRDIDMVTTIARKQSLEDTISNFKCLDCPKFTEHFKSIANQMRLREHVTTLRFLLSDESLQHREELRQRIQVLQRLRYVDSNSAVQLKGRVACEISNHELMITELVFENAFTNLHPTEIVALLSCFVFQQRRCSEPELTKTLKEGKERILSMAERIACLQSECGLITSVEEFKEQYRFGLVEAVFEWARGMPFAEITNLTDVQEGIIVRCIQRLDETCRDVRNAARIIGDPRLGEKMEEASAMIKRDIVFAASLYTQ